MVGVTEETGREAGTHTRQAVVEARAGGWGAGLAVDCLRRPHKFPMLSGPENDLKASSQLRAYVISKKKILTSR